MSNFKVLNLECNTSHESDRVIDFLENEQDAKEPNSSFKISAIPINARINSIMTKDLSYDEFKFEDVSYKYLYKVQVIHPVFDILAYAYLYHNSNLLQIAKLQALISNFKLENKQIDSSVYGSHSKNLKHKKAILLLLNELRYQVTKGCRERGDVLTKLWKAYFKEISNEHKLQMFNKNADIIVLLENIVEMK